MGVDLGARRVLGGDRVVELLLADRLLPRQRPQTLHVVGGLLESRLGRGQVGARVGERRLERLGVDLVEQGALLDEGAFDERHTIEETLDPGADLDVLRAAGLADQLDEDRHVALDDFRHEDFGRPGRHRFFLASGGGEESKRGERQRAR